MNFEMLALSQKDSKEVWKLLRKRWDVGNNYWYPLRDSATSSDAVAFEAEWFSSQVSLNVLHGILNIVARVTTLHH